MAKAYVVKMYRGYRPNWRERRLMRAWPSRQNRAATGGERGRNVRARNRHYLAAALQLSRALISPRRVKSWRGVSCGVLAIKRAIEIRPHQRWARRMQKAEKRCLGGARNLVFLAACAASGSNGENHRSLSNNGAS